MVSTRIVSAAVEVYNTVSGVGCCLWEPFVCRFSGCGWLSDCWLHPLL